MVKDFIEYQRWVQEPYHIGSAVKANMDKTPIPYAPKRKHTLAKKGATTVKAKQLACKVKASEAFKVLQMGTKVLPFMVFARKQMAKLKHFINM